MAVTARAALELASHEALVRQTYKDSVGVLTWCIGMTSATGVGNPAPLQHCIRHFKAGDMKAAETAFKVWNKAGGKTVKGLVTRRALEADLLFRGKWSSDGTIIEYTRLRSNMQVDFASAKRVNVTVELRNAFAGERKPIVDQAPQPDAPVQTPTLSPKPNAASLVAIIVAAVLGFIGWRLS